MQVADLLKTGVVLQMMTSNSTRALYNFIGMNLFEIAIKTYPNWLPSCRKRRILSPDIVASSSIICERCVPQGSTTRQANPSMFMTRLDAVIHYVANSPQMKTLLSVPNHDYIPYDFEPIQLETDVYFQLVDLKVDEGTLSIMKFKIVSYHNDITYLQKFMDSCNQDYERRMANKLGTKIYYFDQIVQPKKGQTRGNQNPLPTTHLMYTKNVFSTTRNFENVYFEEQPIVKKRTEFFLKRKDWYEKKGIPYTLGFMFHGSPGCGKTSEVKAIANVSKRHIINIQLSEIKTKSQLRHLFFNDEIHVFSGQQTEKYTIPLQERLYVIEDIDAMGDVVLDRAHKKPTAASVAPVDPFAHDQEVFTEPIDLSFLLNLLDGTLEATGRMMIITSNYPERIDRALIRPGRIDMIVHFQKCNRLILRNMIEGFYDIRIENHELFERADIDYKWTPAEVNQILFRNFDDSVSAMDELLIVVPDNAYNFSNQALVVPNLIVPLSRPTGSINVETLVETLTGP